MFDYTYVTVCDIFQCEIPDRPDEFLKFWEEKIKLIPKEFKDITRIDLDMNECDIGYRVPNPIKTDKQYKLEAAHSALQNIIEDGEHTVCFLTNIKNKACNVLCEMEIEVDIVDDEETYTTNTADEYEAVKKYTTAEDCVKLAEEALESFELDLQKIENEFKKSS